MPRPMPTPRAILLLCCWALSPLLVSLAAVAVGVEVEDLGEGVGVEGLVAAAELGYPRDGKIADMGALDTVAPPVAVAEEAV